MPNIQFDFVGYGYLAELDNVKRNRIYLDVGNDLRTGVVDHHQMLRFQGSATRLVLANPGLVTLAVNPSIPEAPVTLVLHQRPDLDCIGAVFLACELLTNGRLPDGTSALAAYVDRVDRGFSGIRRENLFSLYAAYMSLSHRLTLRSWSDESRKWLRMIEEGLQLVSFATKRAAKEDLSLAEVDAFECPELFGPGDRKEVSDDLQRYRMKLQDPDSHTSILKLHLPRDIGGRQETDTLFIWNVQEESDPQRVIFFKDWARTDTESSPLGKGFVMLSVFEEQGRPERHRVWISVEPDSGVNMEGLGTLLEEEEHKARVDKWGSDGRETDPKTGQLLPNRPGYKSPDPWYDGRGHDYTIIDVPRDGTALDAEQIEAIIAEYGRGAVALPVRPVPHRSDDLPLRHEILTDPTKRRLLVNEAAKTIETEAALCRKRNPDVEMPQPADVFVSYDHGRRNWVREHVYQPLARQLGKQRIFFDEDDLHLGVQWFLHLAWHLDHCRVFVPVYTPEYFCKHFCQWEIGSIWPRTIQEGRPIVIPVLVALPTGWDTYTTIQGADVSLADWQDHLTEAVLAALAKVCNPPD